MEISASLLALWFGKDFVMLHTYMCLATCKLSMSYKSICEKKQCRVCNCWNGVIVVVTRSQSFIQPLQITAMVWNQPLAVYTVSNKKFELMLTGHGKAYSSSCPQAVTHRSTNRARCRVTSFYPKRVTNYATPPTVYLVPAHYGC